MDIRQIADMTIDTLKESKASANTSNFSALTKSSQMLRSTESINSLSKSKGIDKRSSSTLNMKKKLKMAD